MSVIGSFITAGTASPFIARKELTIEKEFNKAIVKVCGLGQFVLHINGQKVGDHELDPGWTDYRKVIEYVSFDVTDLLQQGPNVVGAEVGNGWFIKNDEHYTFSFPEFMPPNPNPYVPFGKSLVLAIELTVTYTDGTKEVLNCDDTFKVAPHPIIQSNVYGSETIDFALEQKGWNDTGFDDSSWNNATVLEKTDEPNGKLIEQFQPAIKVINSYDGKLIGHKDRDIYDFTQNMAGIISVSVKGKKGDEVRLYPAEKLDAGGDVDQVMKNWCLLDNVITIKIGEDDVWETYRQKFTYFAGRYIAVEKSNSLVEVKDLKADAISSAWKSAGSFTCDNEKLNQIYDMIEKTVEANMMSVHTDCPTIERFAWQEPNHLMAPSIMFMKDGFKLWEKFLMDMRYAQHTRDDFFYNYDNKKIPAGEGLIPSQAPCYIPNVLPVPGMGSFYDIIPWGSSAILGARWHYLFYGDAQILRDNYDMGIKYLNYLKSKVNSDGFISHGLGDWGNPDNELARENIETAFLYADTKALAEMAQVLGKDNDYKNLNEYAHKVLDNYNLKLLKEKDGHYFYKSFEHGDKDVTTQAVEALPLYFDMVPDYATLDVIEAFKKTLLDKGCFASGEIGLPYIIQTAKRVGLNSLILDYILKDEHPSYYAFVKAGMTTLGEYWEDNPRSHCHDMMGHIIEWYYNGIAGIEILAPGFQKIRLNPWMPETVNHFRCSHNTPYGEIVVEGIRDHQGIVSFNYKIPDAIEVEK